MADRMVETETAIVTGGAGGIGKATVRRLLWAQTIFETPTQHETFLKLPRQLRRILLERLCTAA